MKKLLLLICLIIGSFSVNAQLSCDNAETLVVGINNVLKIEGDNAESCFSDKVGEDGKPLKGYWFTYTPSSTEKVTISSDIDENTVENTLLEIFTGSCTTGLECFDYAGGTSDTNGLTTLGFVAEEGVTYYIMWSSYYSTAGFNFVVDINPCVEPTTVFLNSEITTNSATINWAPATGNPANYQVAYYNIASENEPIIKTVDTNKAELTGLDSNANYYFYIRSVCGIDSASDWNGPYLLSLLKEVPYYSNFDTTNENAGWTNEGDYGVNNYFWLETDPEYANTPDNFHIFYNKYDGAVDNWLFSPGISLTKGQVIKSSLFAASFSPEDRSLKITIGLTPSSIDQMTTLYSNTEIKSLNQYEKMTSASYTVEEDGVYYFGINDFSVSANGTSFDDETPMLVDTFAIELGTLAVDDFVKSEFNIFPNPVKNIVSINNFSNINIKTVSITDLNGRIVRNQTYNNITNVEMNISDLAAGVYMMNIASDKGTTTKKIIKN